MIITVLSFVVVFVAGFVLADLLAQARHRRAAIVAAKNLARALGQFEANADRNIWVGSLLLTGLALVALWALWRAQR